MREVTELGSSVALSAGELISTAADINTFMTQLLAGVPVDGGQGHGGLLPGSATRTVVSARGERVLALNSNGGWGEQALEDTAVRTQFCHH
ncbi:hypothetical protein GCM10018785_66200 [Streptomyces longispororuber]|uniref:Uncharacterized protein n=1 Tax=Streptomyces longispororuber TaxID=68230 RepID=A0A919A7F8_9ACTN|nr:hypothetical protein [Streptomyces longispororuber]GHE89989.1 hypothetical protein GCM10018785_66200 [Streptomyces longispororuber]